MLDNRELLLDIGYGHSLSIYVHSGVSFADQFLTLRKQIEVAFDIGIIVQRFPILHEVALNQARESFVQFLFLGGFDCGFSCRYFLAEIRLSIISDTESVIDFLELQFGENIQIFLGKRFHP